MSGCLPFSRRDGLPALDQQVKTIRVKNPITQEFHGTHGTYTQANMEKQRSYNLPQWKSLCEESNHQPPAKRGERRRNQEKPVQLRNTKSKRETTTASGSPAPTESAAVPAGKKRGPGRPRVRPLPSHVHKAADGDTESDSAKKSSPKSAPKGRKAKKGKSHDDDEPPSRGRQPKSVGSRRLHNKTDQIDYVDEEAFKDFDYRVYNQDEWTTERVQELETAYWRSLNFNNPMYGADMPGSLFDDSTKEWNVAKLENLLDVLGQKVPGVNTAYLYLGMWKASFAWHLEDVDLYSINYIHFGAPKQWYSISQEDARRFESAMKSVWSSDAKNCDQFLRHKTYLISPQLLQSQYNIKVNRLVHNEGEFVITFPYGYHSGYNLGYNCAESVNFATDSWLDYGKVARKCNCEADSVWVDVREIERKLRGEPTPEYYEETEDDDDEEEEETSLPTPPGSVKGKPKRAYKRKRPANEKEPKVKVKKLKIKLKVPAFEPCILCPNDNKFEELLPTDTGQHAHRRCGLYTPETYISEEADGKCMVRDIVMIDKARLELKCNYCRSRKGSVFQCSSKKCTKAYHATCAKAAGIQIDIGPTCVFGEDGTEYIDTGYDFRCRVHRSKRSKNADSWNLENSEFINSRAKKLVLGDAVQVQFYQGEIFAGNVVENRKEEQNLLLEVLPKGDRVEVEWKWLLFFDPANSQLPIPSEDAKPLPADMLRRSRTTAEDPAAKVDGAPKMGDPFYDLGGVHKWSEFESCRPFHNEHQEEVDLSKPEKLWFYLGRMSTDAKQHFTHDPAVRVHNPKSSFLEMEKQKVLLESMKAAGGHKSYSSYGAVNQHAINAARANKGALGPGYKAAAKGLVGLPGQPSSSSSLHDGKERPYSGKYAITDPVPPSRYTSKYGVIDKQALHNQRLFQSRGVLDASQSSQFSPSSSSSSQSHRQNYYPYDRQNTAHKAQGSSSLHHSSTAQPATSVTATPRSPVDSDYYQYPWSKSFNSAALLKKIKFPSPSLFDASTSYQQRSSSSNQKQDQRPAPQQDSQKSQQSPQTQLPSPSSQQTTQTDRQSAPIQLSPPPDSQQLMARAKKSQKTAPGQIAPIANMISQPPASGALLNRSDYPGLPNDYVPPPGHTLGQFVNDLRTPLMPQAHSLATTNVGRLLPATRGQREITVPLVKQFFAYIHDAEGKRPVHYISPYSFGSKNNFSALGHSWAKEKYGDISRLLNPTHEHPSHARSYLHQLPESGQATLNAALKGKAPVSQSQQPPTTNRVATPAMSPFHHPSGSSLNQTAPSYNQQTGPQYNQQTAPHYGQHTGPYYSQQTAPHYSQQTGSHYSQPTGSHYSQPTGSHYNQQTGPYYSQQSSGPYSQQPSMPSYLTQSGTYNQSTAIDFGNDIHANFSPYPLGNHGANAPFTGNALGLPQPVPSQYPGSASSFTLAPIQPPPPMHQSAEDWFSGLNGPAQGSPLQHPGSSGQEMLPQMPKGGQD